MSTAAAAAAAQRRREQEEEEQMTPYSPRDLAENWEFKILRSATGAFRDPEALQRFLAEEAQAGWVLVEKFDNSRLRLKRPARAREADAALAFDPYRTNVGMSEGKLALVMVMTIFGVIAAVLGTVIAVVVSAKGP